ncbi:Kazal-type serine protease inhibitor family protein [Roseivirga sp. BDSF3-8]|uniref:Kazal-type serine protease inhibitor family protein n=1 Tax=Roseivirga sp. BDSF3-8 TaxID=3241598 RepID=UPI0035324073
MKSVKLFLSLFALVAMTAISTQSFSVDKAEAVKGCVCPAVYDPVCTYDGKEFSNSCFAECAGYKKNEYESCGLALQAALSQKQAAVWPPYACPDVYDPVCTYDGKQFGNSCYAGLAGYTSDEYYSCGVSVY